MTRRTFLAVSFVLLLTSATYAQQPGTASIYCPPMEVRKITLTLWQAAREDCQATLVLPNGKVVVVPHNVIEPTYVRAANARVAYVDACYARGWSDGGDYLELLLPKEKVVWTGLGKRTALAITASGTLTIFDGRVYTVSVVYPNCVATWQRPGLRVAQAVTCSGKLCLVSQQQ